MPTKPSARRQVARSRARRRTYHHGDLPRALRAAAKTLVAARGADGFTLREAARVVGVNHAAAYRHFADKRALLAALAEEGYETLAARMGAAVARIAEDDVVGRLRAALAAYVRFALDEPALFGLMTGPRLNEDGRFPELERAIADASGVLEAALRGGQERGVFRRGSTTDATLALLSLAHGYAELVLTRRIHVKPARVGEYLGTLLEPLLRGLRPA
jgi:AcrR family transcriptional regulator